MIKGIIFDFGKVLIDYDLDFFADKMIHRGAQLEKEDFMLKIFSSDFFNAYHRGEYNTKDLYNFFLKKAKLKKETLEFKEFVEIWTNIFKPNKGIEEVLAKIKPEIKKIILSNTDSVHWQEQLMHLELVKRFFPKKSQRLASYEIGTRKPERDAFEIASNKLGLNFEQIVLVDDLLVNTKAFLALGGKSIQYDCSKDEIAILEKGLTSLKLI